MLASIAEREQFRSIYAAKIVNNSNPHKLISRKYTNPQYFFIIKITQSPQIVLSFVPIFQFFQYFILYMVMREFTQTATSIHQDIGRPNGDMETKLQGIHLLLIDA